MASAAAVIRALTAAAFQTQEKFTEFCCNAGKSLGGFVAGEQIVGFFSATFQRLMP